MAEFLATPFMLLANIGLYASSLITGKVYFLLEVSEEDEEDNNEE